MDFSEMVLVERVSLDDFIEVIRDLPEMPPKLSRKDAILLLEKTFNKKHEYLAEMDFNPNLDIYKVIDFLKQNNYSI